MSGRLTTKLLRDIWHARGQFIAASMVVMCGLAIYVSLYSTYENLKSSRDSYYERFHFAHFFIELERAPVSSLRLVEAIPGVLRAQGRIVQDVTLDVEGNEGAVIGRIISLPADERPPVNDIHIVSGSYFSGSDQRQVIVNQRFCEANDLRPGDSFLATFRERKERLRIVGTAYSPEYVYPIRNPQQLMPNDRAFAIVFVRQSFAESALQMGGAVNNIVGLLRPGADVTQVLELAEKRLDRYGVYHKYGRDKQLSNVYVREEIQGLRGSAVVLPMVFLLIAALIVHVIMSRITEMQRTQIGLLCALGYSRAEIVLHYLGYAGFVAVVGTLLGTVVGQLLALRLLKLYVPYFRFPVLEARLHPELILVAFALSAGACVLGTILSVRRVARLQPAQAMRPPSPPSGHRIRLEQLGFLWKRLGLEWRITLRNMVRARARTVITILGVTVATLILIVGLTGMDFWDFLMEFHFNKVDRADVHVGFQAERPLSAVADVARLEGVRRAEGILQYGFEFGSGWRKKTVLVMALPPDSHLYSVYDTAGRRLDIPPDGLLIPDRLGKMLRVTRGSSLAADPYVRGKDEVTMPVRATAEQFIGLTAYADRAYLSRALGEPPMVNGALLAVKRGAMDSVIAQLKDVPGVSSIVSNRQVLEGFEETVAAMSTIMTVVLSMFAGVIAFAVIYNTSTVNISERRRELASLRAMGLNVDQVARIGTNDIVPLGVVGIALALPLARLITRAIARLYETDLYKVPAVTYPRTYVLAMALVIVFLLVSRWICKKKVRRIDIMRVLKTRE